MFVDKYLLIVIFNFNNWEFVFWSEIDFVNLVEGKRDQCDFTILTSTHM